MSNRRNSRLLTALREKSYPFKIFSRIAFILGVIFFLLSQTGVPFAEINFAIGINIVILHQIIAGILAIRYFRKFGTLASALIFGAYVNFHILLEILSRYITPPPISF